MPADTHVLAEAPPASARNASIVNLGCKVNQAEMEAAARLFRARGVRLVRPSDPADVVLVNTCTVTGVADEKSRAAVRRARRASPDAEILVTGCSVQVAPEMFAAVDPTARLLPNDAKAGLVAELERLVGLDDRDARTAEPLPTLSGAEPVTAVAVDGADDERASIERTRAFVKVQDGCSFYCTYCIIPRARGAERSLPPDAILADVRRALAEGHREIVLTGINVGTYDGGWSERGFRGSHVRSALTLAGLIRRLLAETDIERIRLSSIEPQHVDDALLDTWGASDGRCLPHFHLPLQSADDGVLRRMGRRYTSAEYASTVRRIRSAIRGAAVHADVIVGFPTEDESAFEATVDFVRELELDGLHVFRYSRRPGTAATRMAGHVDERVKKRRAARLLELGAAARARRVTTRRGGRAFVLLETPLPDDRWLGHAEDDMLVTVMPRRDDPPSLENAIADVTVADADPAAPGRAVGRIDDLRLASRPLPRRLAMVGA